MRFNNTTIRSITVIGKIGARIIIIISISDIHVMQVQYKLGQVCAR